MMTVDVESDVTLTLTYCLWDLCTVFFGCCPCVISKGGGGGE